MALTFRDALCAACCTQVGGALEPALLHGGLLPGEWAGGAGRSALHVREYLALPHAFMLAGLPALCR